MDYAIELGSQQSVRTLEQAVRYQATVLLEPATWPTNDGLKGRLVEAGPKALRVEITEPPMLALDSLVNVYCDGVLLLGQDRFLLNEHVIGAELQGDRWYVELARPARLLVCERRRFWRVRLAESSELRLTWDQDGASRSAVGQLCNISGEGLACLIDTPAAQSIRIGEEVLTTFELPGCETRFDLAAVLCSRTPAADREKTILGMQFLEPASSGKGGPVQRLSEFLLRRYGSGVAPMSGATRTIAGGVS